MKTTIKVQKFTVDKLKKISQNRGRNESMDQVILELISKYYEVQCNE